MAIYSGIAEVYLQQEDWNRIVQDPDVQQQLLNLFAPEGYENLSAEKRAELNKVVKFLVSDPSGFTGMPYLIKKVQEGDLLAIAQFVGLVSKIKGVSAVPKALGRENPLEDGPAITVKDHYTHHKDMVDDLKEQLESQGFRFLEKKCHLGTLVAWEDVDQTSFTKPRMGK